MKDLKVVGIDPASGDYHCSLIDPRRRKPVHRQFSGKRSDLQKFVRWVKEEAVDIIAIEGRGGLAIPLENVLRSNEMRFYGFNANQVAYYRKSIYGQNKNNHKDAISVANFAIAQAARDQLEKYERRWFPDPVLRPLTRLYEKKKKAANSEINRLWDVLHNISVDLYLALRELGKKQNDSVLTRFWMLELLATRPEIQTWHQVSPKELGGEAKETRPTVLDKIAALQKVTATIGPISKYQTAEIKITASTALSMKKDMKEIKRLLENECPGNPYTARLLRFPGIGPIIAAVIVAEMIDIRRFANNHKLASYSGFGRRQDQTGDNQKEKASFLYNHRLKNAFFSAARCHIANNSDSHLSGYFRACRKKGLTINESYKRVGRAILRRVYRELVAVNKEQEKKECEGNRETVPAEQVAHKQPHTQQFVVSHSTMRDTNETRPIKREVIESMKKIHGSS